MSTDHLVDLRPSPSIEGLVINPIRSRGVVLPATVQIIQPRGAVICVAAEHAAQLGAHLIAAAAVAMGRLDSADPQPVLDAAQAAITEQIRVAYVAAHQRALSLA